MILQELKQIFKEHKIASKRETDILKSTPIKLDDIAGVTANLRVQRDVSELLEQYGDASVNQGIILKVIDPSLYNTVVSYLKSQKETYLELEDNRIQVNF